MTTFAAAIFLLFFSAILALMGRKGSRFWDRLSLVAGILGAGLGFAAAIICLLAPDPAVLALNWPSINGFFVLRIDALSGIFLAPAFVIAGTGLVYGSGYLPQAENLSGSAWVRFFYPMLTAAIALVLAAGNGVVFLIAWEVMALSGYFLVISEREKEENHRAGYIYLAATHSGTLALFGLFALLGDSACLVSLPAAGALNSGTTAIFLLTLIGFGFKAGIMPFHIWLPGAHAAAPSHVSALMSGVMIKTGIYGILRIMSLYQAPPAWWGWTILGLGLVSGILGVVFAIAQHDIKRLLAYHSIENIGIILLGMGTALLGKAYDAPAVAALGLAGTLLHVVNHGFFKGLLFLAAGSMIKAVGSRRMDRYGGLLKSMPYTGFFFLGGAVAICGLPPLNGFVSEWLVYLGLFQAGASQTHVMNGALLAAPGLAMIGGLALLCFAKVFGLCFLGTPRHEHSLSGEAPVTMLSAMGVLFCCCLWIGVLPGTVLLLLDGALKMWMNDAASAGPAFGVLAPGRYITIAALLLIIMFVIAQMMNHRQREVGAAPTWGCGYNRPISRGRYTTSSFAEMITGLFDWVLHTGFEGRNPKGIFAQAASFKSHTPDAVLDRILEPVYRTFVRNATFIRRILHQGVIGIYLLYSSLALCVLLILAIFGP